MIETTLLIIAFLLGYNIGMYQVNKVVKKEVERQIHRLSDWTLKDDH